MNYTDLTRATFSKLYASCESYSYRPHMGGHCWQFLFANGYGASIVKHYGSYGGTQDYWELAVLHRENDVWNLCYDTHITYDVIGWLSEEEILNIVQEIQQL